MRTYEDPVITPAGSAGQPDRTRETHPAYAQIGASRGSGGSFVLYGSDFIHNSHITIRIAPSELDRDLNHDWPHESLRPYIEVILSEAQWATFVSSLNMGAGVQCTLTQKDGVLIPGIPEPKRRVDQFNDELKQDAEQAIAAMATLRAQIEELPIAKKHKDMLLRSHFEADRKLKDSIPFVAKSFAKHVETTTERAKIEIHAHAQNILTRLGLKALGEKALPFLLGGGNEDDSVREP
jgi:hypothetical protein